MANGWQTVELGKVMQVEIDAVPVDAQPEFHMAGVYSFARGLFKREPLPNTQTTYKVFHRLHKDMYVISVPKGWEGALARVTDDFDGMFLSPVYPTFRANPKELDIQYFEWYCRQSKVWDELRRKSRGIGARRESISAQQFLTLEIPLPSLTEQRRIVAHIESLAARVNEAQSLREEADNAVEPFLISSLKHTLTARKHWNTKSIANVSTMKTGTTPPSGRIDYFGGDIQWFTPGDIGNSKELIHSSRTLTQSAVEDGKVRLYEPGTILFVGIGTIGKVGIIRKTSSSNQQITGIKFSEEILPDYAYWFLRSLAKEFKDAAPYATLPIINQRRIGEFEVSYPPLDEQRQMVAYLDGLQAKVNALRGLQSQSQEELDALLPSVLDKAFKGEL